MNSGLIGGKINIGKGCDVAAVSDSSYVPAFRYELETIEVTYAICGHHHGNLRSWKVSFSTPALSRLSVAGIVLRATVPTFD